MQQIMTDRYERTLLADREHRIGPALSLRPLARLIAPIPPDRRARRFAQLYAGLVLYGLSDGLLIRAGLGVDPWDVLHMGLARHLGAGVGTMSILVGAAVLLLWIPLRQKPGFSTINNVVIVGLGVNTTMMWVPAPHGWLPQWSMMLGAVVLNGVATGAYIGAGLGAGPRDGLMTGYAARGHSIRVVRTAIELSVLAGGWLLGGSVGAGTVAYAVGIGPLAHLFIPLLAIRPAAPKEAVIPPQRTIPLRDQQRPVAECST